LGIWQKQKLGGDTNYVVIAENAKNAKKRSGEDRRLVSCGKSAAHSLGHEKIQLTDVV